MSWQSVLGLVNYIGLSRMLIGGECLYTELRHMTRDKVSVFAVVGLYFGRPHLHGVFQITEVNSHQFCH